MGTACAKPLRCEPLGIIKELRPPEQQLRGQGPQRQQGELGGSGANARGQTKGLTFIKRKEQKKHNKEAGKENWKANFLSSSHLRANWQLKTPDEISEH